MLHYRLVGDRILFHMSGNGAENQRLDFGHLSAEEGFGINRTQ